ncbi:MAG: hypothetical protein M1825_004603 [Sarcosagium campestre]|nr:MAG: hypothetical protein M1825_004603 [Sarcosagium campestre]
MLTDQKTIPVDIDVLDQIKQYFPRLSHDQSLAWLVDRLGSALSQQRRYLRHLRDTSDAYPMRDMFAELSTACGTRKSNVLAQAKETELSSTNLKLTPGIEGSKETYKIAPLEEVSHMERAGGMNLGLMTAFDRPFQCPYCWTTQVVSNESMWRQHVWSDIVPYICTFEQCDTEVFGDSQAWYEHQIHKHFMEWHCPFCPNHFHTLEDFHSHLKGYSLEYSKTQLNAISSACRHPKQQIASSACLLCKDTDEMVSLDHFKDHVCGHLEHISLFIVSSFMQEAPEARVLPSRPKSTLKMSNPGFRADVADTLSKVFGAVDEDIKSLLADDVDLGPVEFRLKTIRKAVRNPECKLTKLLFTHDEDSKTESGIPSSTDLDHVAHSIKVIIREIRKDDGFDPNSQDDAKRTALSLAAERGDLAAILVLLNLPHLKEEPPDTRGRVSLHYATEKGHYAAAKLIMKKWPTSLNAQDDSGASPLILAVANRHEATAILLLQIRDFNAGLSQNSQRTALSLAAENGSERICQELLARTDVEPDSLDSAKRSPLMYACKSGALGVVSMLLGTDKVNVDKWDDRGQTVLYFAVLSRNKSIVELLLSQPKIDINHPVTIDKTALMLALEQDDESMAALLVRRGAEVEIFKPVQFSAAPLCNTLTRVRLFVEAGLDIKNRSKLLSPAAKRNDPEVLSYLLSHGADVDYQNSDGQTAIFVAASSKIAELLISKGANPHRYTYYGETPLIIAVKADRQEVVELLLSKGANVNHSDSSDKTALHYACSSTVASTLLDAGANLDYRNHAGQSPLTSAVIADQADIVHLLIKRGAEVNRPDAKSGRTPIFFAKSKGVAELLVYFGGAEIGHIDYGGESPLSLAINTARIEVACFLIQSNASTRGLTKDKVSKVELPAIIPYDKEGGLLEILLDKGADPDYANEDGMTALSFAAAAGHVEQALILLKFGATVDFPNSLGMTALTWATLFRQREVTQLLLRWNADRSKAKLRNLDPELRIVEDSYKAHFIFKRPAEYLHGVCDLLPASRELLKKSQHGDRLLYSQSTSEFLEAVAPEKGATVGSRAWKK